MISVMTALPQQQHQQLPPQLPSFDWLSLAEDLGARFSSLEQAADISDVSVAENFEVLRQSGLSAMGVPTEFGGGGASYIDICQVLQILGRHCSSTALALAMHTHQTMISTWKWQQKKAPVEGLLRQIAQEKIILLNSSDSDGLAGSGTATRTAGGFLINGRKRFASGYPARHVLITSAVYDDPTAGPTVLHFSLPMKTAGVSIKTTWQALGMRCTSSHDIILSNVFVPEHAITLRRPAGQWHPTFHLITMIAMPILGSVYVGIAEAVRNFVIKQISKHCHDDHGCHHGRHLLEGLDHELATAKLTLKKMILTAVSSQPGFDTTQQIMTGQTLVADAVLNVVDKAMDIAGGHSFQRSFGLEKLFRDAQGVRYHPF